MTLDFSSKVQNLALIFGIDLAQPHTEETLFDNYFNSNHQTVWGGRTRWRPCTCRPRGTAGSPRGAC